MGNNSGLGSITSVGSQLSNRGISTSNSTRVFASLKNNVAGLKFPNITLFNFDAVKNPEEFAGANAAVNFIGSLIEGEGHRKTFREINGNISVISPAKREPQHHDEALVEFLSSENGMAFVKNQYIRRPVHILADFDYATLNLSLDNDDSESATNSSGAARMWSRNANAREWKNWLSTCLLMEMAFGGEDGRVHQTNIYRPEDNQLTYFALRPPENDDGMPYPTSTIAFRSVQDYWVLKNLIQGYSNVYNAEHIAKEVVRLNPFAAMGTKIEDLKRYISWVGEPATDFKNALDDRKLMIARGDDNHYSEQLAPYFKFNSLRLRPDGPYVFQLHNPEDQQGFIKSVIETTRNIASYLDGEKFIYREQDKTIDFDNEKETYSNSSWSEISFNEYKGSLKELNLLSSNGNLSSKYAYLQKYDVYGKAYKIRRILLNSLYLASSSQKLFLKSSIDTQNSKVVDANNYFAKQDDIEKLMSRVRVLNNKDCAVVSPYLAGDYVSGLGQTSIQFLTMNDALNLKKKPFLELFSTKTATSSNKFEVIMEQEANLKLYTFDFGPNHLEALMDNMINHICPIKQSSSDLDKLTGLLLSDHRNIVSHLTRGLFGQFVQDATFEKIRNMQKLNSVDDSSTFKIKITNGSGITGTETIDDIFNGHLEDANENLVSKRLNTDDTFTNNTQIHSGFVNSKNEIPDDTITLLNSTFVKHTSSALRKEYIFYCILLQLSDVSLTDSNNLHPYFMNPNAESGSFKKLPEIADKLFSEYISKTEDNSFTNLNPGQKISNFFSKFEKATPSSFSQEEPKNKSYINGKLLKNMRDLSVSPNAGGPLDGAFSSIVNLQDKINHFPALMDNIFNMYKDVLNNLAKRIRPTEAQTRGELANSTAEFFQEYRNQGENSFSLVVQDFLTDGGGGYQANPTGRLDDEYVIGQVNENRNKDSRSSRINFEGNNPQFDIVAGHVVGVHGRLSGGAEIDSGFASAILKDDQGQITDNFKNSALGKIKGKIISFNRKTNPLIMLAENICAQLFFGFPNEEENRMFERDCKSSFQRNDKGLLQYLNLISNKSDISLTASELFDVVWSYVTIADQLLNWIPSTKIKFDFDKSVSRETHNNYDVDEYTDVDEVYSLIDANASGLGAVIALDNLQSKLDDYLPPEIFDGQSDSKNSTQARARQLHFFGGANAEEAEQRKRSLVSDTYDMVSRASIFFHHAEKEIAKEPIFKLKFSKWSYESNNTYELLADNFKLGFLDHVSIDNDFARHAVQFMHNPWDPRGASVLMPMAIKNYVGLRKKKQSPRGGKAEVNNVVLIGPDRSSEESVVTNERYKINYHMANQHIHTNTIQQGDDVFNSMSFIPNSFFGFVYNVESGQANLTTNLDYFSELLRIPADKVHLNEEPLNQFTGYASEHSGRSVPGDAEATMTSRIGYNKLQEFYAQHLAITPPKIYKKLLKKVPAISTSISNIKNSQFDASNFRRDVSRHSKTTIEYNLHQLTPPQERKRKKISIEITVKKNTYQFMKALEAKLSSPIGDTQVLDPIRATEPAYAGKTTPTRPRQYYARLADAAATCLYYDVPTHNEKLAADGVGSISSFKDIRLDVGLSPFGEKLRNWGMTIPVLDEDGNMTPPSRWNFNRQFGLLCALLSQYGDLFQDEDNYVIDSTDDITSGLNHHPATNYDAIRDNVRYSDLSTAAGAYVWNKFTSPSSEVGFEHSLLEWIMNHDHLGAQNSSMWNDYWYFYSRSATHGREGDADYVAGQPSTWYRMRQTTEPSTEITAPGFFVGMRPDNPAKTVLLNNESIGYRYDTSQPPRLTVHQEDLNNYEEFWNPEYHSANLTKQTVLNDQKIKVDIYLATNQNGEWTHFSTEPIYTHETNHPSARTIDKLYSTSSGATVTMVVCRPSVLAGAQYKFNNQDPKYWGPKLRLPDAEPHWMDGYFVNENLPFIHPFRWSTWFLQAINFSQDNGQQTATGLLADEAIQPWEFLGQSKQDFELELRSENETQRIANEEYAIYYFEALRRGVEDFITEHVDLGADTEAWLREIPGILPYFYDWSVQYPSAHLKISIATIEDNLPGDLYLDLNWGHLKKIGKERNPHGAFAADFYSKNVNEIYKLELQYLNFLFAVKEYANLNSKSFTLAMNMFSGAIDTLIHLPEDDLTSAPLVGPDNKEVILNEIKEFVNRNGIINITPDVLANLDSIYRLWCEQYNSTDRAPRGFRHKSWGLKLLHNKATQVPFKISPYDIRPPMQVCAQWSSIEDYSGHQIDSMDRWKQIETVLASDTQGLAALDDNNTRVCFIGIESGELHKIISAPLQNYGDSRSSSTERRKDKAAGHESFGDFAAGFKVKLELFDFFRPWLKFEYQDEIILSRSKPYRITTPINDNTHANELHQNSLHSRMIDFILKDVSSFGDPGANLWEPTIPTAELDIDRASDDVRFLNPSALEQTPKGSKYNQFDVYLKTYASHVLGLDFFEFMIPKIGSTAPIADYQMDGGANNSDQLPEERNYQEYLNEYTEFLVKKIKESDITGSNFKDVNHILKYFLERKNLQAEGFITGEEFDNPVRHYDNSGRITLIPGEAQSFALLQENAVNLDDKKLYPFRFTTPITETSLAASEVLTSVNEYSTNTMREFRDGFAFDRIVGIPYKLQNFKLSTAVRTSVNEHAINIENQMENFHMHDDGYLVLNHEYKQSLMNGGVTYLERRPDGEAWVKSNSLYPLTLRATVCRIEDNED